MTLKTVLDHSATCTLFCTIGLVAIGATLPLPAAASPPGSRRDPETTTKIISLSGLDLATAQGQREARSRLARAAEQLCRKLRDDRRVDAWAAYSDCTRDALASALKQLIPPTYAQPRLAHRTSHGSIAQQAFCEVHWSKSGAVDASGEPPPAPGSNHLLASRTSVVPKRK